MSKWVAESFNQAKSSKEVNFAVVYKGIINSFEAYSFDHRNVAGFIQAVNTAAVELMKKYPKYKGASPGEITISINSLEGNLPDLF
jgi:hypothetical protein